MRGQEKEWMGYFLDDLRAFSINADRRTTAAQCYEFARHILTAVNVQLWNSARDSKAVRCILASVCSVSGTT